MDNKHNIVAQAYIEPAWNVNIRVSVELDIQECMCKHLSICKTLTKVNVSANVSYLYKLGCKISYY